jgi:NAD(P)-dependent dehydrogenase (short-subunit alcohol dehydrogenase family)
MRQGPALTCVEGLPSASPPTLPFSGRLMTDHFKKFSAESGSRATPGVDATREMAIAKLSISQRRSRWHDSSVCSSQGAIGTLVKHFASMLGARGILVNAVAPVVVETDMSSFTKTEAGRDFALGMQALKRLAQPDDIGGVVAFLASEDAGWITCDTIHVDGSSKL